MATSIFKGYVRHNAGQLTDNSAFGAAQARDHLVNNANHIADSAGQVLINWTAGTSGAADSGSPGYLTPTLTGGNLAAADTYYRVTRFGPLPILVHSNGASYALRGRIRAYLSAAGTATFRAVICTPSRSLSTRNDTAAANAFTFVTTATSDAWDNAETDNIATLTADDVSLALTEQSTLAAVGGAAVSVYVALVTVDIYAKSSATTSVPRLTGFYLAGYVGA